MALKHTDPTKPRRDRNQNLQWALAPYNFVPLPERMVEAREPLEQNNYSPEGRTGWIECHLETCSPVYVRGMLAQRQFELFGQADPSQLTPKQKEEMAAFFSTGEIEGRPVPTIPGSTLRGLVRSLVEIVGHGRMHYVATSPTFTFRAVAASADDPLRDPYRDVVGPFARNVRAGYLKRDGDEWWIHPAIIPKAMNWPEQGSFLKVKERDILGKAIPGYIRLNSPDYRPQWHWVSFNAEARRGRQGSYTAITQIGGRADHYTYEGILVCSGNMLETGKDEQKSPRKNHALILPQDPKARRLKISPQAVRDYLNGLTPFQQEKLVDWGSPNGCLKENAPVFYVPEGNDVRYFGHSPNFRIPARLAAAGETRAANPRDFVPPELLYNSEPDLAEAIFGWVEERDEKGRLIGPEKQRAGRVFFSDAHFVKADDGLWLREEPITPRTLSSPKPTTFQHYLVQDGRAGQNGHHPDDKKSLAHYGTPPSETQIRGHKLYWHRGSTPDIEATATEREHEKQLTRITPLKSGVHFSFRVYFENLRDEELGALWWALALPGEPGKVYRHKLGMGKPLGMGAVAITPRLVLTNRPERYATLFQGEGWQEAANSADPQPYQDQFEIYLLQEKGIDKKAQRLVEVERIQSLLTMLEWHEGISEWLEKTRYLEIRRGSREINEYKERPVLPNPQYVANSPTASQREATQTQPRPADRPIKPVQPSRSDRPQPGDLLQATVYYVESNGDVFLELKGIPADKMMGRIKAADLGGKRYQEGNPVSCEVVTLQEKQGEIIVECRPAGTADQTGVVKKFNQEKGYGFIRPDNGAADLFVHKKRLSSGLQTLHENDRVVFKIGKGLKGPEAQDVRLE